MTIVARENAAQMLAAFARRAGLATDTVRVIQAMPHMKDFMSPSDIVATLRNLAQDVLVESNVRLDRIAAADCPCLLFGAQGQADAILDVADGRALILSPDDGAARWTPVDHRRGRFVGLGADAVAAGSRPGIAGILAGFGGSLGVLAVVSFVTTLLSFTTPLLVMVIYDHLIPTASTDLLWALIVAVAGVFLADMAIRMIRGRALAWMGAQIERRMGLALFRKLTALPLDQVQKSSVARQIARLKQFEGLRGIFTGPIVTTVLDAPFSLFFLAVIWALAPHVGLLVMALMAIFGIAAWVTIPVQTRRGAAAAADRARLTALLIEAARYQRDIYRLGIGATWAARCETASRRAAASARAARQFQMSCQAFGQTLMIAAGVGAVVLGTYEALTGTVSFGALIALIALVWKVLSPAQTLFACGAQIAGYARSARQVDAMLGLPEDRGSGPARAGPRQFHGGLTLEGVALRYPGAGDTALAGVSLSVRPGELVMVCGRNGSGKSSLLKVVDGLHRPASGTLLVDGIDYRQIAMEDLRSAISFVPQTPELFHGSVLQNLLLAAPTATEETVAAVLRRLELDDELMALPDGLDTRLSEEMRRTMSRGVLQGLSIARGVLRDASIYLFDEPCSGLDGRHEAAVLNELKRLRGQHTTLVVTDRPSHLPLADRLIFLERGRVVVNDTGADALNKVRGLLSAMRKV